MKEQVGLKASELPLWVRRMACVWVSERKEYRGILNSSTYLCNRRADVKDTDLGALFNVSVPLPITDSMPAQAYPLHLVTEWDSICDNKGREDTAVECLDRTARQDPVGDKGEDGLGTVLLDHSGCLHEGACIV